MIKKSFSFGNFLFYATTTLISIFLIYFLVILSKYCCFWGDDAWFSLYVGGEQIFDSLTENSHGGKYLGQFLDKFLSMGLPLMLGIHPENFMSSWHALFRGIFFVLTLLYISKFAVVYKNSKPLYLLFYCFLIVLTITYAICSDIIVVYYAFYRYCFSLLFFGIFWLFIFKNITGAENNTSKLKLILVSLCGYVAGTSSEIVFFTSCALISLLIIWESVISRIACKFNGNDFIDSLKIKLNKNFYVPVLFFTTGVILFVSSAGFREVSADRGMANINITLESLKEFSFLYTENCFFNIKEFWFVFIILFCTALYFAVKNKDLKPVVFSSLYIVSLLTVMFSLVLCGKTHGNVDFYILHDNILFVYKMLLIIPFAITLNYVYSNSLKTNKSILIFYSVIIILFGYICTIFLLNSDINRTKNSSDDLFTRKHNNYITEKITRFYYLNNAPAILPIELTPEDTHYIDNIDKTNCVNTENQIFALYGRIYKTQPDISNSLCISDNAINEFYDNGGYITKEEMKNLDFNRLFDENYVLKKKENEQNEIYTPEEVNELIKIFPFPIH